MARRRMKTEMLGLDAADKLLRQLPKKVQRRAVLSALMSAARPIAVQAEWNARSLFFERTGRFFRNIKRSRVAQARIPTVRVGVTSDGWHGALLELGTPHVAPKPWLRPAAEELKNDAVKILGTQMGRVIVREAEKLSGQTGARRFFRQQVGRRR